MHKRRRVDTPDDDDRPEQEVKLVQRDEREIRHSLEELHERLSTVGDLVVAVQGAESSGEFYSSRALLASASRPLNAMLFGQLPTVTRTDEGRYRLCLHDTEPWCFDQLLRFIHGLRS